MTMVRYEEVELTVESCRALLPCNLERILDIYDPNESIVVGAQNMGSYLSLPDDYTDDTVFINYVGTPLSNQGIPLIVKGHENACELFCKIRTFEEDMVDGRFDKNLWMSWDQQFSGMCQNALQNWKHKTRDDINKLQVIRGNMIPVIGLTTLFHKRFD